MKNTVLCLETVSYTHLIESAFLELCRRFDVQRPLQLPKHNRVWDKFGRTFYTKEHFTEPIDFDKLEV